MKCFTICMLVSAAMLTGCKPKPQTAVAPPPLAPSMKRLPEFVSPEATFAKAKAAAVNQEYKAFCDCWTDDCSEFVADFLSLASDVSDNETATLLLPPDATIDDVKIEGDRATAIIKKPNRNDSTDDLGSPVEFARVDGEWKFVDINDLQS